MTMEENSKQDASMVVVIPMRGGSKRLPGKHLKTLGGRTLIEWTSACVSDAKLNCPVLLTTNSEELAEAGKKVGWTVPTLRPAQLAQDHTSSVDPVLHIVDFYSEQKGEMPDLIVLAQVTSPFRPPASLRIAADIVRANSELPAAIGVSRNKVALGNHFVNGEGYLKPLGPTQKRTTPIYTANGSVYAIRTEVLRSTNSFLPEGSAGIVLDTVGAVDIDTEDDFAIAEAMAAKGMTGHVVGVITPDSEFNPGLKLS